MADTRKLWEMLKNGKYDVYLSTVTLEEIVDCPEPKRGELRKLREYNYEMTKDMSPQERRNYYNEREKAFLKEIEAGRLQKA
ncbi:MAG: hypothetical protein NC412_08790 [Roseburia sp.]|nr:hypothetical protein [Roseburia sp.]MCM1277370.1 hypothetical protein [Robinsoniella sp.]